MIILTDDTVSESTISLPTITPAESLAHCRSADGPNEIEVPKSLPGCVRIAVDTEYQGPVTLTVQVAVRLDRENLAVQVYRHDSVPDLPALGVPTFSDSAYHSRFSGSDVRPVKLLSSMLSPGMMICDLHGITGFDSCSRSNAEVLLGHSKEITGTHPKFRNVIWNTCKECWQVPEVKVEIIGHFLRADICRMFGSRFVRSMRVTSGKTQPVQLAGDKILRYVDHKRWNTDAILEYLYRTGEMYALRVSFKDTNHPFGSASLDSLSKTFLDVGKCKSIHDSEKGRMADVFREKPKEAYQYAMTDPVNTLLVYEAMESEDHRLTERLGLPAPKQGSMPPTLGGRVTKILIADAEQKFGASTTRRSPIRALMKAGGHRLNLAPYQSKFGDQVLTRHGGLLYTRSPHRCWHESPGQLRDVDLKACYCTTLTELNVYLGRPILLEPGAVGMTLKNAVDLARRHADDDAWLVRVTGDLPSHMNALISSTDDAMTSKSFRAKSRISDASHDVGKREKGARLYTSTIRYGVVTAATWHAIEMMPSYVRAEYERLTVDTLMLYPRTLIADIAVEYAELVRKYARNDIPWEQDLDFASHIVTERKTLGAEFVSFRYPIHNLMGKLSELRQESRERHGKGSGAELSSKQTANTVYGVLASRHKATFNVMAANRPLK